MFNYYTYLSLPFFDDQLRARLNHLALASIAEGTYTVHDNTWYDNIHVFDPSPDMPELRKLVDDCTVALLPCIFLVPPGKAIPVHKDDRKTSHRLSTIVIPLSPVMDYAATHWFEEEHSRDPAAITSYDGLPITLLNISRWHAVPATAESWRCTMQLSLTASYDDARELISHNRLFRSHDCQIL